MPRLHPDLTLKLEGTLADVVAYKEAQAAAFSRRCSRWKNDTEFRRRSTARHFERLRKADALIAALKPAIGKL